MQTHACFLLSDCGARNGWTSRWETSSSWKTTSSSLWVNWWSCFPCWLQGKQISPLPLIVADSSVIIMTYLIIFNYVTSVDCNICHILSYLSVSPAATSLFLYTDGLILVLKPSVISGRPPVALQQWTSQPGVHRDSRAGWVSLLFTS